MSHNPPNDDIKFETARLAARTCRLDDAAVLSGLMTADISRWVAAWPFPLSVTDAAAIVDDSLAAARRGDAVATVIVERSQGNVIGWLKLTLDDRDRREHELGYWIGEAHQRQGYAFEISEAAIAFAFAQLGARSVTGGAQIDNHASHALLAKLGMQRSDDRMVFAPARQREELCRFWRITRRPIG